MWIGIYKYIEKKKKWGMGCDKHKCRNVCLLLYCDGWKVVKKEVACIRVCLVGDGCDMMHSFIYY